MRSQLQNGRMVRAWRTGIDRHSRARHGLKRYESSSEPSVAPIFMDHASFGRVEFISGVGLVADLAELWVELQ